MYGSGTGTLQFKTSNDGVTYTTEWTKTGQQTNSSGAAWGTAQVKQQNKKHPQRKLKQK